MEDDAEAQTFTQTMEGQSTMGSAEPIVGMQCVKVCAYASSSIGLPRSSTIRSIIALLKYMSSKDQVLLRRRRGLNK